MQPPTPGRSPVAEATLADFASDRPSDAVVSLVAEYTDQDALELPSLYDAVDTDALDRMMDDVADVTVTFEYLDYEVELAGETIRLFSSSIDHGDPTRGESGAE